MKNQKTNVIIWFALLSAAVIASVKCLPNDWRNEATSGEIDKREEKQMQLLNWYQPILQNGTNKADNAPAELFVSTDNVGLGIKHEHRVKRSRRKGSKFKKGASIHVVPKMENGLLPIAKSFDAQGNINSDWEAKSSYRMKLIIDSRPRSEPMCYNEVYIVVRDTGHYFIYGQIFFHGQNHEMGHCLYVADSYRPCGCSKAACEDRKVMCSRSAPGHPASYKVVKNINTNYIGGVVYLKKGSTIRLGVDPNKSMVMSNSVEIDKAMCYFGAFAV